MELIATIDSMLVSNYIDRENVMEPAEKPPTLTAPWIAYFRSCLLLCERYGVPGFDIDIGLSPTRKQWAVKWKAVEDELKIYDGLKKRYGQDEAVIEVYDEVMRKILSDKHALWNQRAQWPISPKPSIVDLTDSTSKYYRAVHAVQKAEEIPSIERLRMTMFIITQYDPCPGGAVTSSYSATLEGCIATQFEPTPMTYKQKQELYKEEKAREKLAQEARLARLHKRDEE